MQLSFDKINDYFPFHRTEVKRNFLSLILLICQNKTCNLFKLADHAQGEGKFESSYTKLIRFFRIKAISEFNFGISLLLFKFCLSLGAKYLIIDRTNWKKGNKGVNILTLGFLLSDKVFIPIGWADLEGRGNSSTLARIDILNKLKKLYEFCKLEVPHLTLLADREFIGKEWFSWLSESKIGFTIRLRSKNYLSHWEDELDTVCDDILKDISKHLNKNKYYSKKMEIEGNVFYFSARKTSDQEDPILYLLSTNSDPEEAAMEYKMRWAIETFFKNLKSNGFNLESLNFKKPEKIELLLGIVTICYVLAIREGYKVEEEKGVVFKQSKGKIRKPDQSSERD